MVYEYDKNGLKNSLSIEQVARYLEEFDADPEIRGDVIVARTVCHNKCGCGSHKLYYYGNTGLFKCYTDCGGEAWDIFELTRKVMSREQPKMRAVQTREGTKIAGDEWNLPEAIDYVARFFHFAPNQQVNTESLETDEEYEIFDRYDRIKDININTQQVELKEYEGSFLKHLPHPIIQSWIDEGISKEVMDAAGICYDPRNCGIVIPHYDINNRLIGIRERTLIKEQAEQYGKYMPAKIANKMYNHPLSFNIYNLNHCKENISRMKKVFVFEGEKSCLKYRTMFGENNDLSTAICGSSFINYQAWLLMQQGAEEIIVGLDKQFQTIGDAEYQKLIKNLKNIHKKYGNYVTISYLFDKKNLLGYKDSPIDKGKDIFLQLYKERVNLYNEM